MKILKILLMSIGFIGVCALSIQAVQDRPDAETIKDPKTKAVSENYEIFADVLAKI